MPALSFAPRPGWCTGCQLLDTPWAKSDDERRHAVGSGVSAYGAGPDFVEFGLYVSKTQGILGIFGPDLAPVAGFFVDSALDCGRISSARFSVDGAWGIHQRTGPGMDQSLFVSDPGSAATLFQNSNRRFTWPGATLGAVGINDMWFSTERQAIDLSGDLWVADLTQGTASRVATAASAPSGQLATAVVSGKDVFVQRFLDGVTDYWLLQQGSLVPFLGGPELDIKELVTDGQTIVWLQGTKPVATDGGPFSRQFTHYALYASPYTTDAKQLAPRRLLDSVDSSLSHLVMANGYVAGVYLLSRDIYRSAALLVRSSDGHSLTSILPNGYSWGYEVYPAATELWGAVTPGPMIEFETIARVPYSSLE